MNDSTVINSRGEKGGSRLLIAVMFAAITLGLVVGQSRVAVLIWMLDGALAVFTLLVAAAAGAGVLSLFRLGPLPLRWRIIGSAGLGVGLLSLLVLGCGLCGWIGAGCRWVCPALLVAFAVWGVRCFVKSGVPKGDGESAGRASWLLLVLAPSAALVALVATLPPGILWGEEGFGYDVLEYHLQLPREYYENSAITYLPHNVYASFPSSSEMLYLFSTLITGEPIESWSVSKCFNALLAVVVVAGVWLAGRERSPRVGLIAAIVAGSAGWLVYLSGVAYVENGLLAMEALSLASVLRAGQSEDKRVRWVLLGGVFAGLACGFKYTGGPLIALPVMLTLPVLVRSTFGKRLAMCGVFAVGASISFSPWLMKNVAMTGNPVFPLLGEVFTSYPEGWGAEEAAHFAESHAPAPEERTVTARLGLLWEHVPGDKYQRFGAIAFVMALVGLLCGRSRIEAALAMVFIVEVVVWLFGTHMYARFAVPMLIPLALLAGAGAVGTRDRLSPALAVLVCAGAMLNAVVTARLYAAHVYRGGERLNVEGATAAFTDGWVDGFEHLRAINHLLPADARVLLVGDARPFYVQRETGYCVVFNADPFATTLDESPRIEDVITWLRGRGYTHVFVNWSEIARLRRSRYGFPESICELSFEELEDAGMRRIQAFSAGQPERVYGELYEVPGED